jgi:hypothetical protein
MPCALLELEVTAWLAATGYSIPTWKHAEYVRCKRRAEAEKEREAGHCPGLAEPAA